MFRKLNINYWCSSRFVNKLKHFIPIKIRILIYNSPILSYLNYCILAWGYQYNRLIKLQKEAVRIVSLRKYN